MFYLQAALLGLGLAMDAAAVSMADGLKEPHMKLPKTLLIAGAFGLFQGAMPLVGYLAGSVFSKWLSKVTPILALIILSVLGARMIVEGIKHRESDEAGAVTPKLLAVQAFATSIDALTVGVLYVSESFLSALSCFAVIAAVTFLISALAVYLGRKIGTVLSNKAEIAGGIILIAIGVKIFVEYLVSVL